MAAVDFQKLVSDLLSASLAGQQRLFSQYLHTTPEFANVTPIVRRGLEQRFNPLSAQYLLRAAGGEGGADTFSDFLNQNFSEQGQAGGRFQIPSNIPGLFGTAPLSPVEEARRNLLEDEQFGRHILEQYYGGQVNPLLRQFVPEILERRFARAQAANPEQSLFRQFVRGAF